MHGSYYNANGIYRCFDIHPRTLLILLAVVALTMASNAPAQGPAGRKRPAREDRNKPSSPELSRTIGDGIGSPEAPLLFCIGLHIEPFGAKVSSLAGRKPQDRPDKPEKPSRSEGSYQDYTDPVFFNRHVNDIGRLAEIVASHHGRLTVQAQTAFTRVCVERKTSILADLLKAGNEIALHLHEDAHLGRHCDNLEPAVWTAIMKEEMDWIQRACPDARIRYWSGGNNYPQLLTAAADAGLEVMSDHKNPHRQQTFTELLAINPWRPAGGPTEDSVETFARHDPQGKIIYLPDGIFSNADFRERKQEGNGAYFDSMTEGLELSLKAARADRVNVFHLTVHPGEFRGAPGNRQFDILDRWLTQIVDPLVKARKVRWATFSEMAEDFKRWEKAHPGVDPRGSSSEATAATAAAIAMPLPSGTTVKGYMTFAVNVHDFPNIAESADTLLRLAKIFQKNKVRGDFYFTGPVVERYIAKRPDLINALKNSAMTISYHLRPPHPAYTGFDAKLRTMDDKTLRETLLEYETFGLDLASGEVRKNQPGGYTLVSQAFGRPPVCASTQTHDRRIKSALNDILKAMGACMTLRYHETGTDTDKPFEYMDGLLVRPSDFSITRWTGPDESEDSFWWNRLAGRRADPAVFDPLAQLKKKLQQWKGPRPPFITALIHENNFYHSGPETWKAYFLNDTKTMTPRQPPYPLDAPDPGRMRSTAERENIFEAYESLVAYAAANLTVVTSEDIVRLAKNSP
ncbi:MAG: hypothetical protein PHW60_07760 [Kiritimatiellae bacterium]|nr:hypothetical protein [Kiritimatiellia bacterium]